jgi:hypothetical protein
MSGGVFFESFLPPSVFLPEFVRNHTKQKIAARAILDVIRMSASCHCAGLAILLAVSSGLSISGS